MNPELHGLFALGATAVVVASLILFGMVHRDLGPRSGLSAHRRWLLAGALGAGIVAFSVKLAAILAITNLRDTPPTRSDAVDRAIPDPVGTVPGAAGLRWVPMPTPEGPIAQALHASRPGYRWQALPDTAPAPDHNPTTPQKVALGAMLFDDTGLSRDGALACSSCHDLYGKAGADGRTTALGIEGRVGARNTPSVWNAGFQSVLFWDGRAASLEEQAKGPLLNPDEMGMPSLTAVEERVRAQAHYRAGFARAFGPGVPITIERIVEAIAAYERTLVTPDSAYDRFVGGDLDALTPAQLRGMAAFESFGCIACHFGANFSAASRFDDRAPWRLFPAAPTPFAQRYDLGPDGAGRAWRVPSLRNVALTGPWLHNGAVTDLAEVVRIMASAQLGRSGHYLVWSAADGTLRETDRAAPSEREVDDLVAFLNALSSDRLLAGDR